MDYFCYDFLNIWLNTLIKARIGKICIYYDILTIILDLNIAKIQASGQSRARISLVINIVRPKYG